MRALLTLLLLLTAQLPAHACDCIWRGPFIRAAQGADLVVAGSVSGRQGNAFRLTLAQTLKGQVFTDQIQIWGAYRDTCRPDVERFEPGSEWLLALRRIETVPPQGFDPDTPNVSYGLAGDYTLDSCGVTWLPLKDGLVKGNLTGQQRWDYDGDGEPVLLEMVAEYLRGELPEAALVEAAKPNMEARQLLQRTRSWLRMQEDDE
jgi:hypothetical protein